MAYAGQQGGNDADDVDASSPTWQDEVKRLCTWMRIKQQYPRDKMVVFKRELQKLVRNVQVEALRKVEKRNMGQELGVDDVAQELAQACESSMWARDAEERALKSSRCYVPPIKRFLGERTGWSTTRTMVMCRSSWRPCGLVPLRRGSRPRLQP